MLSNHFSFRESDYTGVRYTSATQLVGRFKAPFDEAYWSLYKAAERLVDPKSDRWLKSDKFRLLKANKNLDRLLGIVHQNYSPGELKLIQIHQQEILNEWLLGNNEACEKGTRFHLEREHEAYSLGYQTIPGTNINLPTSISYSLDLNELPDGYYTTGWCIRIPVRTSPSVVVWTPGRYSGQPTTTTFPWWADGSPRLTALSQIRFWFARSM